MARFKDYGYKQLKMLLITYDPAILLKIIILAYSKGITSNRKIEALCRENIIFMVISADSQPHFTTIADFISHSTDEIAQLFKQILLVCEGLGLIGHEIFAIDGCKLPFNTRNEHRATLAELTKKHQKIDKAVPIMLDRHKQVDRKEQDGEIIKREQK